MKESTKKWMFLIASIAMIISGIIAIVNFVELLVGTYDLSLYIEIFEDLEIEGYVVDIEYIINIMTIVLAISNGINIAASAVCATFFMKGFFYNEEMFAKRKNLHVILAIVALLFGLGIWSLAAFVCVLIATLSKKQEVKKPATTNNTVIDIQPAVNEPQTNDSDGSTKISGSEKMIEQIAKLKQLKESGAISEEEYSKLLSEVIK